MNHKIWLIGGTSDSAVIAQNLAASSVPYVVTVTTPTAKALYAANAHVVVGSLDLAMMRSLCQQHQIAGVIDASHPYAVEVSTQAIAVTTQLNLPYLRYERSNYRAAVGQTDSATELDSLEQLLAGNYLQGQRVLLTIGCKALPLFQPWQSKATLFARVLPKVASLETALNAGFTSDRLIAVRPPLSLATEKALWQQWQISLVVTKASGTPGGENFKRQVAKDLGISLIVIARPTITYPQQTSDVAEVLNFCRQLNRSHFETRTF